MHAEPGPLVVWIERLLLGTGIVCSIWWGVPSLNATRYQHEQREALDRALATPAVAVEAPPTLPTGAVIGSLEIPRLRMSAMVVQGDDDKTLGVAVGHLPDTPLPWHDGNSALAGHRDTLFRPLRQIRVDDVIRVRTPHGDFQYQVRETLVVDPKDVWVLEPTDRPMLTLITCYPFTYVGKAPRRFIVRAERTLHEPLPRGVAEGRGDGASPDPQQVPDTSRLHAASVVS